MAEFIRLSELGSEDWFDPARVVAVEESHQGVSTICLDGGTRLAVKAPAETVLDAIIAASADEEDTAFADSDPTPAERAAHVEEDRKHCLAEELHIIRGRLLDGDINVESAVAELTSTVLAISTAIHYAE